MSILISLIIFSVGAWLLYHAWNIYQNTFVARRLREEELTEAMLAQAKQAAINGEFKVDAPLSAPSAVVAPLKANEPRPALLNAAERVAYLLLKSELPEYEILSKVDAASLLTHNTMPPARIPLDFVLCKRDFNIEAVIMLKRDDAFEQISRQHLLDQLKQRGLRTVSWHPQSLPKRGGVRQAIFVDA